jgi:outer membrane receptor for ferrienterochelin and colicin
MVVVVALGRCLFGAALIALLAADLTSIAKADEQTSQSTVTIMGSVIDQQDGLPIPGAGLELQRALVIVATTKSDKTGAFKFQPQPRAVYTIVARATGYATVRSNEFDSATGTTNVTLTLRRAQNASDVREIGRVVVTTRPVGLQTTTTIQHQIDPQLIQRTNQIRVAEGLVRLPGVNFSGQDSSVGDDVGIDIRGLKPSETQVMLDGHPIGPLGVYPSTVGGGIGFDWQVAPTFALRNAIVTYGSGAVGVYGVDAVGGSVDLQTLNPTVIPQNILQLGIGTQGKQVFSIQTSGTDNKLGYVLLYGVSGTYGDFPAQPVAQTGARGSDFTSATLAADTYIVTGNYLLRNGLVKLRYDFSRKTFLTLTGYSATSWDDKTGNGDNDFVTYELALNQALQNPNCSAPGIPNGVTVQTDAGTTCVTPQQYASGASGPQGGGGGAFQALRNQDFHARFLSNLGRHSILVDAFVDNYGQDRQRSESFLQGPLSVLTNVYRTVGVLVGDDIAGANNDLGFGFYTQRQYINGDALLGDVGYMQHPALYSKLQSVFVRDAYTPTDHLSFFANAWLKYSLLGGNSFDPRLSIVYQPNSANVIRLTGGGSSADPTPIALTLTGPGGLGAGDCSTGQFNLGTVPSPGELPEKATDLEMSIAHRFFGDTSSQLTLYDTHEVNTIFAGLAPASQYLGQIAVAGPGYIPSFYARIESLCPSFTPPNPPPTVANLNVSTNLNVAKARAQGFEFVQRLRVNPRLFFDSYYDVQSTVISDAPDSLLMNNLTLINGSQLPRIPLHKEGLSGDWATASGGEFYLVYTHFDGNNDLNRGAYGQTDFSFTQKMAARTLITLGISNLFNNDVDTYGRIGYGVFVPENKFGTNANGLQQGSERFGLSPSALSVTVTQRF